MAAVPQLRQAITRAARTSRPPGQVMLDLSAVTFLDAAMLGALVTNRRALLDAGGDLQLTGVSAWTMRIIEICGLRTTLGL